MKVPANEGKFFKALLPPMQAGPGTHTDTTPKPLQTADPQKLRPTGQGDKVLQWKAKLKTLTFYFDGVVPNEQLLSKIEKLGASVERYLSYKTTTIVSGNPALEKGRDVDIVSIAKVLGMSMLPLKKLERVIQEIMIYNESIAAKQVQRRNGESEVRNKQPDQNALQNALRKEKIFGLPTNRTSTAFKPFTGFYVLAQEVTGQYKAVVIKEYPKDHDPLKTPWPQIYFDKHSAHTVFAPITTSSADAQESSDDEQFESQDALVRDSNASGLVSGSTMSMMQRQLKDNPALTNIFSRLDQDPNKPVDERFRGLKHPLEEHLEYQKKRARKDVTPMLHHKPGYCENCNCKVEDYQDHFDSAKHRNYAKNPRNFLQIDRFFEKIKRNEAVFEISRGAIDEETVGDGQSDEVAMDIESVNINIQAVKENIKFINVEQTLNIQEILLELQEAVAAQTVQFSDKENTKRELYDSQTNITIIDKQAETQKIEKIENKIESVNAENDCSRNELIDPKKTNPDIEKTTKEIDMMENVLHPLEILVGNLVAQFSTGETSHDIETLKQAAQELERYFSSGSIPKELLNLLERVLNDIKSEILPLASKQTLPAQSKENPKSLEGIIEENEINVDELPAVTEEVVPNDEGHKDEVDEGNLPVSIVKIFEQKEVVKNAQEKLPEIPQNSAAVCNFDTQRDTNAISPAKQDGAVEVGDTEKGAPEKVEHKQSMIRSVANSTSDNGQVLERDLPTLAEANLIVLANYVKPNEQENSVEAENLAMDYNNANAQGETGAAVTESQRVVEIELDPVSQVEVVDPNLNQNETIVNELDADVEAMPPVEEENWQAADDEAIDLFQFHSFLTGAQVDLEAIVEKSPEIQNDESEEVDCEASDELRSQDDEPNFRPLKSETPKPSRKISLFGFTVTDPCELQTSEVNSPLASKKRELKDETEDSIRSSERCSLIEQSMTSKKVDKQKIEEDATSSGDDSSEFSSVPDKYRFGSTEDVSVDSEKQILEEANLISEKCTTTVQGNRKAETEVKAAAVAICTVDSSELTSVPGEYRDGSVEDLMHDIDVVNNSIMDRQDEPSSERNAATEQTESSTKQDNSVKREGPISIKGKFGVLKSVELQNRDENYKASTIVEDSASDFVKSSPFDSPQRRKFNKENRPLAFNNSPLAERYHFRNTHVLKIASPYQTLSERIERKKVPVNEKGVPVVFRSKSLTINEYKK